ncbi:MAG: DUF1566 domain-containing protein [Desulfatirhabdiaceae bacterium]
MKPIAFAKLAILAAVICLALVCPAVADLINNENGTVTDTETGLTWEQDSHGDLDWKSALNHCDTLSLAGHDDWRMPTIKELDTIADLSRSSPAINTYYFSDTAKAKYWSATTRAEKTSEAWVIDFTYGDDANTAKTTKLYVRAVRGGPAGQPVVNPSTFYDNGDGTVTDSTSGLMWQQTTQTAATWKDALAVCGNLNLGVQTDWRLPTIKELAHLTPLSRSSPAINTYYFPDTVSNNYWSGTTRLESTREAWCINFLNGDDATLAKSSTAVFRAVRGGPQQAPDTSNVFIDNGNGTVTDYTTGLTWTRATVTGKDWRQALEVCDSLSLGGYTDWRMPTIKELDTIASLSRSSPAINTFYFPDTVNGQYWSATTRAEKTSEGWIIDFTYGDDGYAAKSGLLNVRAVRGGGPKYQPVTPTTFIDNGDGTVTDHITGLMWQEAESTALNWKNALAASASLNLGGYTDWRTPTIKELATLASLSRSSPAINTFYFPTTASASYWSSTTRAETTSQAWVVNFSSGDDNYLTKTSTANVRAVRSGPAPGSCYLLGYLTDAVTGKPLAGVTVMVDGVTGDVTDASGIYYIPGLGCGAHTITVIASGYAIYSRTVDVSQGAYLEISLTRSNTVNGLNNYSGHSADPVNTATGNYIYTQKDFEIPGIGLPIIFERTYNSQDGTDSPLGYGWNHTYNPTLTLDDTGVATIRWGDGKTETWISDGAGGYGRQYGVFDDLIDNGDGTLSLKKKDGTRYLFNASGRLASITDKNDNVIELVYANDLLVRIIDTAGREIQLTHNESGRITQITDPAGRTLLFDHDESGNLVSATNMNGHATTFVYDDRHQVLSVTDPKDNVIVTNTYDPNKRVVTCQKDAKQGETRYVYDDVDRKTTITDSLGYNTIHAHDELLRLIAETDPLRHTAAYEYDDMGNRVTVTDKNSHITRYTYDVNGNVLSKTDALGQKVSIEYDAGNNPLKRTDAPGNVTAFQYDGRGNLIRTSDAIGNLNAFTYTEKGQPLTLTDANGQVTTYGYDADGNRNLVRGPQGQEARFTHDATGRMMTQTDPLGQMTSFTRDGMGNLLTEEYPDGTTRQYAYDANNNKIRETDALGHVTTFAYDIKNLLVSVTDALDHVRTFTHDALDRILTETDPNGHVTQYAHDAVGNLIRRTNALGQTTVMAYDANGNRVSETSPAGHTHTFGYNALNRLITRTDPLGNVIQQAYDANDRLIAQTDASGNETRYVYDVRGRLIQVMDADGGTASYTYDGNGNRLSQTDPNGQVTRYRYDRADRLVETTEPLGGKFSYGHDAANNRISVTDSKGQTLVYAYDSRNRMTRITRPDGGVVTFGYAANGLKTGMTDPLGTTQYLYDDTARLTAVTDPFGKTVQYTHDAAGNQIGMIYPDGKTVTYAYDGLNRLVSMTDWMGRQTTYAYNPAGDLVTTTLPNGMTTTTTHDAARRMTGLASEKSDGTFVAQYAFTLDATGNHVAETRNEPLEPVYSAKEIPYTQDAENRLVTAGSTTFTHDVNGNMTGANGRTFVYDPEDRLIESASGGKTRQYGYDGVGNRYIRTISGQTVHHILDVSRKLPNVIAETTENGEITAYYVYGLGLTAKVMPDGAAFYYHFDARGSTVALTDANQNVTAACVYGPFGEKLNQTGDIANPFTFMGRYGVMDDGDGMYYARARYYWPEIGRFVNKDRLTGDVMQTQSLHRYVYGINNPVMLVDPNGEVWHCLIGAGIGAAFGAGSYIMQAAIAHEEISGAALAGAALGGAVTGALYTLNPVIASSVGSAVNNLSREGFEKWDSNDENDEFDTEKVVLNWASDTVLSAGMSFMGSGIPKPHYGPKSLATSVRQVGNGWSTKWVPGSNYYHFFGKELMSSGEKTLVKGFMKLFGRYPESTDELMQMYGGHASNQPYIPESGEVYAYTHKSYIK